MENVIEGQMPIDLVTSANKLALEINEVLNNNQIEEDDVLYEENGYKCTKGIFAQYSDKEVVTLLGISQAELRELVDAKVIFPIDTRKSATRTNYYFDAEEIWNARQYLGAHPKLDRENGEKGSVLNIMATKGGVGKTTVSTSFAGRAALLGYRTVLVDFDPQSSTTDIVWAEGLSERFSLSENAEFSIVGLLLPEARGKKMFLLEPEDRLSQDEFERHIEESFDKYLRLTAWRNLKLIAGHIDLNTVELNAYKIGIDITELTDRFKFIIEKLREQFDIIIIDNQPSFSQLSTLPIAAADSILMPTKLSIASLHSLKEFLIDISKYFDVMNEVECQDKLLHSLRIVVTDAQATKSRTEDDINTSIIQNLSRAYRIETNHHNSEAIKSALNNFKTIFEIDKKDDFYGASKTIKKATDNTSALCKEILEDMIMKNWPSFRQKSVAGMRKNTKDFNEKWSA